MSAAASAAVLVMAGRRGSGGRAGRGCRIEGALSAQMSEQSLPSAGPVESERFEEGRAEFGGHDVVQDGINGRIEVEHDSTKVEDVVISLDAEVFNVFVRRQDEPQGENAEGQEADEEEDDNRAQHRHHLAPGPQIGVDAVGSGRYRRRRLHLIPRDAERELVRRRQGV